MTGPGPQQSPRSPAPRTRLVIAASVLGLALFTALGFVVGATVTDHRHELGGWQTAIAHVGARQISIDADGWTYGATGSVNPWIDHAGSWHDSGWPDCLRVPPGRDVRAVRIAVGESGSSGSGASMTCCAASMRSSPRLGIHQDLPCDGQS